MSYKYPYGNTEQMNLDWFLKQWETFKADWAEAESGIDGSLDAEIAKVEAAMSELYAARDAAAASASAARQSSLDAAAAQVAAGNSKTAAQAAETAARGSQQAAAESAQEAQASAQGAENSALTASQAANTATQQAAGADAAKGAAEAAQQAAEDAQAAAAQSAGQAGQAATAAGDHADDAANSATLAQQAAQDMSDSVNQITTNKNDISVLKTAFTQLESEVITKAEIAPYATNTGKRVYESGGKWWCWGDANSTVKKYVLETGAKYTLSRADGNVLYGFTNNTAWNTELFGGGESTTPVEFTADGTYLYLYSQDVNSTYPTGACTLKKAVPNFVSPTELVNNTFVSGYGTLDGWESHATAFSKLMADVSETEGFLYFTDAHFMAMTNGAWKSPLYAIMSYLEKLYYASPCSFVLNGGDWLGTDEPRLDFLPKLSVLNGAFRRNFDKYAMLVGNHECGNQSEEGTMFTHDTIANTLLANVGRTYYTFDANTFKMYCFDSWQSAALDTFAGEQIAWFAHSLESENAKHIVVAIHILYDAETLRPFGEQISLCAEAYNGKSTYTYGGTTYDFSSATGKVGFIIAGHEHADKSGTLNNIPYIITRNLTGYSITDINSEALPLDLMKVDWDNATLTAYRVSRGTGGGTTRTLSIIV